MANRLAKLHQENRLAGLAGQPIGQAPGLGVSDVVHAIKETPENLKIGALNMGSSALGALIKRSAQLTGAINDPDFQRYILNPEPVGSGFEAPEGMSPENQKLFGYGRRQMPGLLGTIAGLGSTAFMGRIALKDIAQQKAADQVKLSYKSSPISKASRLVHQGGTPSMLTAIGVSALTGSPVVGLMSLGEIEGGGSFFEQLEDGSSVAKASVISELSAAAEIGGELLVFPKIFKGIRHGIPLKRALELIAENAGQEALTGFTQTFLDTFGKETNAGTDPIQAIQVAFIEGVGSLPENALVGGLSAGMVSVPSAGVNRLAGLTRNRQSAALPISKIDAAQRYADEHGIPVYLYNKNGEWQSSKRKSESESIEIMPEPVDIANRPPWELTQKMYTHSGGNAAYHENAVRQALENGDMVTREVLRSYADQQWAQEALELEPGTDEWFKANRQKRTQSLLRKGKDFASDVFNGMEKVLTPMSSRIRKISEPVFRQVRGYIYKTMQTGARDAHEVRPFLKAMKKMDKADRRDLELSLINGFEEKATAIADKYGLQNEYKKVRSVLNQILYRANQVGMEIDKRDAYWPRKIKDSRGLLRYISDKEDFSVVHEAIAKREEQAGRKLDEEEKARLTASMLRGYRIAGMQLARPGAAKERRIDVVDKELEQFYKDPDTSIIEYIFDMNQRIAAREFFGRETKEMVKLRAQKSRLKTRLAKFNRGQGLKNATSEKYDMHISEAMEKLESVTEQIKALQEKPITDTIGGYVMEQIEQDNIKETDQKQLQGLLEGIFAPRGMGQGMRAVSDIGYITTLGNPIVAFSQAKDLAVSFYRSPRSAVPAAVRSLLGKAKVKLEDIGITDVGQEFRETSKGSIGKTAKVSLYPLSIIDRFGKQTYVETVLDKYRRQAARPSAEFTGRIQKVFGDESGKVINDLKSGQISDNVKMLLFSEVADIHPIAISEMPEGYAKSGNGRIFYMLKTFSLRQLDFIRNEALNDIKNKRTALRGFRRLVYLLTVLSIAGAGVDLLKEFLRGRKPKFKDEVFDNLAQLFLFSRYSANRAKREGLGRAVAERILPPTKTIDAMTNAREGDVVRSIPLVGENYYWWFGKGRKQKPEGGRQGQKR